MSLEMGLPVFSTIQQLYLKESSAINVLLPLLLSLLERFYGGQKPLDLCASYL